MNTILRRFCEDTAFILESRALLLLEGAGVPMAAEHPFFTRMREQLKPKMTVESGVATIPVEGVLAYNPDPFEMAFMGVEDSRNILEMVNRAAADKSVEGILLAVDSPGGFMTGGFEIADAISAAGRTKLVVAHIGGVGASLAYMIASQANEIVSNRSATVGSIGAYSTFTDVSRMAENAGIKVEVFKNREATYKAAGVPGTSLTPEQRENMQARAQQNFNEFKATIVAARPDIPESAMRGQTFSGSQAKANGLVDRIGDSSFAASVLRHYISKKQ